MEAKARVIEDRKAEERGEKGRIRWWKRARDRSDGQGERGGGAAGLLYASTESERGGADDVRGAVQTASRKG